MARNSKEVPETIETEEAAPVAAAAAAQPILRAPRMGEQIHVVAGAGRVVRNLEFGGDYSETEGCPVTVNLRVLRLLADGDLIRQA
jgi:hypothetical protein